jgi:hypothetical protein
MVTAHTPRREEGKGSGSLMKRLSLVLTGLLALASLAAAHEVVIIPDRDNTLIEQSHGGVLYSNGLGKAFYAGNANASNLFPLKRALLRFGIAGAVPPGSTIESVSLRVRVIKRYFAESEDRLATLHVVTADWGEGTSESRGGGGTLPTEGDTTWLHTFYPDQFWAAVGGDFVETVSGSAWLGGTGHYTFESTPQMVADVQAWLDDPSTNFGWMLRGDETLGEVHTARKIGSRENQTDDYRPKLRIEFTAPPEQACRFGSVDLAVAGVPQNVLTINGSAGNGGRVVRVPVDERISIDVVASASGPDPGPFVLYLWDGKPEPSTLTLLPKSLGTLCFPMLATGGEPQPRKTWNNLGRYRKLGSPDFPSTPAPSNVLDAPRGVGFPVTATLQGILLDNGSVAEGPASITNAVVLRVEE